MSVEAASENRNGPEPDRDEIVGVMQIDIDGVNSDIDRLRECFHEMPGGMHQ